ncbi:MAG TPA: hypothetical protein VLH75_15610 [Longimicrobiales bacterium]|nr:hypothetical protein [Longimicrobiales bacterium]
MKALGGYAVATTLIVTLAVGGMWAFLDADGRSSLLLAAGIALPIQWALFLLLVRALGHSTRFLLRWGIGILARMALVAAVGLLLPSLGGLDGGVLILSLCGFFFVLLLLEPLFFRNQAPARFAQ